MPTEKPTHTVKVENAGLMIDNYGDIFDCMGRYTSEEIKDQFGPGKRGVRSLKKTDPELKTEMLTALNMKHA